MTLMKMFCFHPMLDVLLVDLRSVVFVVHWKKTDMERHQDVRINAVDAEDWDILKEHVWKQFKA
jgi:hypothetical protein